MADSESTFYDRDTWVSMIHLAAQDDTTATFTLTMSASVDATPSVVTNLLCHD